MHNLFIFAALARADLAASLDLCLFGYCIYQEPKKRPPKPDYMPGAYRTIVEEPVDEAHQCRHGRFSALKSTCICDDNWVTANIWDTVDFARGVCEQYQCTNDKTCQKSLGLSDARCPVPHSNCYCGGLHAMMNWGTGYSSMNGRCMGLVYTFLVWAMETLEFIMSRAWKVVIPLVFLLLPIGRKRAICDHHRPSLWLGLSSLVGLAPTCRGDCVLSATYTHETFRDDIAWSLYVMDIGAWLYVFLFPLWFVTVLILSISFWMAVIAVFACSLIVGACCSLCIMHGKSASGKAADSAEAFYWSGTFPNNPWWICGGNGYKDVGAADGSGQFRMFFCTPIHWLFSIFPALPENAWGGFCGYFLFGTHQHTSVERLYRGGNPIIDFLGMRWRRTADLHEDQSWRLQVCNFIMQDVEDVHAATIQDASTSSPREQSPKRSDFSRDSIEVMPLLVEDGRNCKVATIGCCRAIITNSAFEKELNECAKSSLKDYEKNTCWICMESREEWDLWLSCGHLFCASCSTDMLRRSMPCPLCRVSSSTVLRGFKVPSPGDDRSKDEAGEQESAKGLPPEGGEN